MIKKLQRRKRREQQREQRRLVRRSVLCDACGFSRPTSYRRQQKDPDFPVEHRFGGPNSPGLFFLDEIIRYRDRRALPRRVLTVHEPMEKGANV